VFGGRGVIDAAALCLTGATTAMKRMIRRFALSQSGATAIEYVMIAMLIALAIISGATLIGKSVANDFNAAAAGFTTTSS
jgi:pilus assembly protein Flp/PilA